MNVQANPLMKANGVSNKKENQKELPIFSHNPGIKYKALGFKKASKLIISVITKTMNNGK